MSPIKKLVVAPVALNVPFIVQFVLFLLMLVVLLACLSCRGVRNADCCVVPPVVQAHRAMIIGLLLNAPRVVPCTMFPYAVPIVLLQSPVSLEHGFLLLLVVLLVVCRVVTSVMLIVV